MDNTAEKETGPARTFAEMIRLNRKTLFLHTITGRRVTVAAGLAAVFTAIVTKDVGLAAACGALLPPAILGRLAGENAYRLSPGFHVAALAFALTFSSTFGLLKFQKNTLHSLPEMDPNKTVVTTAKKALCDGRYGWIAVTGQKLNCGG